MRLNTRQLVQLSLLLAVALILSFVELFIPNPFPYPGVKLGLTNIVTVFLLYNYDFKTAALITVLRIFLANFLFGSISSLIYSLAGGVLSLIVMELLYKLRFNIVTTSICGGISHNMGQLILASLVVSNWNLFLTYLPVLILSGFLVGLFIGLIVLKFNEHYQVISNSKPPGKENTKDRD